MKTKSKFRDIVYMIYLHVYVNCTTYLLIAKCSLLTLQYSLKFRNFLFRLTLCSTASFDIYNACFITNIEAALT